MEVPIDPLLGMEILRQLRKANQKSRLVEPFVRDYQTVLEKNRVNEARARQLDKECTELREEAVIKEEKLMEASSKLEKIKAAEKLEQEMKKVKAENAALTGINEKLEKEVATMATKLQASLTQKESVLQELAESLNQNKELTEKLQEIEADLENEKRARELAVHEYQVNKAVVDEACKEKEVLEFENLELINRLKGMKMESEQKLEMAMNLEMELNAKRQEIEARQQELLQKESKKWTFPSLIPVNLRRSSVQVLETPVEPPSHKSDGSWNSKEFDIIVKSSEYCMRESRIPQVDFKAAQRHRSACTGAAFSPSSGTVLVTSGQGGALFIWDASTRSVQKQLYEPMEGGLMDVAFTCTGSKILAGAQDNSVRVWNILSGTQTTLRGHQKGVNCVASSPADQARGVSSGEDKRIILWDLNKGVQLCSQNAGSTPCGVCITREGNNVISGHANGGLRIWDIRSHGQQMAASDSENEIHRDPVASLSLFPTRQYLLLSAGKDNTIKIIDLRKFGGRMEVVSSFYHSQFLIGTIGYMGRGACGVGISPDDKFIAAGSTQGDVFIWKRDEPPNQAQIMPNKSHRNSVVACAWSPNWDNRLVSCDKDGVVVFWEDVEEYS